MADADGLMSAPPGVAHDAGNANTVSQDVAGAIASAMARQAEIASDTLTAGQDVGDLMPLPGKEFSDTTELQGEPGSGPDVPATGRI